MTHLEIVKKLIGEIKPVGESHTDEKRLENLKQTCDLVNDLVAEIELVSKNKDRHEHSMRVMGEYAYNFLRLLKI